MFGDHQPKLEDSFYEYVTGQTAAAWDLEQLMKQYKTPFIIWHNYETESTDIGDVSLNYLASIMLMDIGLDMSEYQSYVLEQYQKLPVISNIGAKDSEEKLYRKGSQEFRNEIEEYRQSAAPGNNHHTNDIYSPIRLALCG